MPYYTYTQKPIGCFWEKEVGNYFEYSLNDDPMPLSWCEDFPHKVWVGGQGVAGMTGYRYATVKKTVAYIVVDEDENGPVVEKWFLKKIINMQFGVDKEYLLWYSCI